MIEHNDYCLFFFAFSFHYSLCADGRRNHNMLPVKKSIETRPMKLTGSKAPGFFIIALVKRLLKLIMWMIRSREWTESFMLTIK